MNELRQAFIKSVVEMGFKPVLVEPEVAQATIQKIRCATLADMIAHLINETEPLLKAEADGPNVTVSDGDGTMRFTVTA